MLYDGSVSKFPPQMYNKITKYSTKASEYCTNIIKSTVYMTKELLLFVFFWVIPWRLIYICRCFGTLYLFHLQRQAFEDGTDRVFRNDGIYKSDAGESPKRKQTTF